jgi:amidophosphoribosyltransferase
MSDPVKHECGIALVRLLKPLEYYHVKYGSWQYGLQKIYLLMEKQHNRGQDGAGLVSLKLDMAPGIQFFFRHRTIKSNPIQVIFKKIQRDFLDLSQSNVQLMNDPHWAKANLPFAGELYLGHLRYGTFGQNRMESVHPVIRLNNWRSRNLALAGNFNLTNVDELFNVLLDIGQHPIHYSDTVTILEKVGYYLDNEHQEMYRSYKRKKVPTDEISALIEKNMDIASILRTASRRWDGGFAIAGIFGHGEAFAFRDPWGIRPAYYYHDEEIAVVTSERPVIRTVLNVQEDQVKEVPPGYAMIIGKAGNVRIEMIREPQEKRSCSFERIYFSRGSDQTIYQERKKLGELLTPQILKAIDYDLENTVFSYIPNTAEPAFYGMIGGIEKYVTQNQKERIMATQGKLDDKAIDQILGFRPRIEKIAIKDIKLRTFIAEEKGRDDLVGHVYDITYGTVREHTDNLVVIDDSIVRGTTLKKSIIRILDRLHPKRIVIVSSSPQIRYPDCYGIDMAKLSDFIAFQAAVSLLRKREMTHIINEVYNEAKRQEPLPKEKIKNPVTRIYEPFSDDDISNEVAEMLRTEEIRAELKIVYQTVANLHIACPDNKGDWYFTGVYPTPGGNKVVNTSFINFIEKRNQRAY